MNVFAIETVKTMKWGTLLKDLKDKVGGIAETDAELTVGDTSTPPSSSPASPSSSSVVSAQHDFNLLSPTRYFTFLKQTRII